MSLNVSIKPNFNKSSSLSGIVICSTDHEQMKFWSNVTKKTVRARSYWLTTTVFCTKTTNFLSSAIHTWLYNFAEELEGHGAGVGDVREQSECATASTMMTHLVPCETKACEALNWHTRREPTSRQHMPERGWQYHIKTLALCCVTDHHCIFTV